MTYSAGSPIQASDYNTFATAAAGMNQIFADLYPGATTLPNAGYGYGQTPALTSVSIGDNVTAAQWTALFQTIRKTGVHQEGNQSTVVPPLPAPIAVPGQLDANGNPISGATIFAYNTPPLQTTINNLGLDANRFKIDPGQSGQTTNIISAGSAPWTNSLQYTFTVNLGTWDQARYFFNSGGWIGLSGSYPAGAPGTVDAEWNQMFSTMGTIAFRANITSAATGIGSDFGLWNNTGGVFGGVLNYNPIGTTYVTLYTKTFGGGGYYSGSTITFAARQTAVAPAAGSGTLQFLITLTQGDTSPPVDPKTSLTTFTMSETHSASAIPFLSGSGGPGPASVIITPGTFTLL